MTTWETVETVRGPQGPQGFNNIRLRGRVNVVPNDVPTVPPPQRGDAWFDASDVLWVRGDESLGLFGLPGRHGNTGAQGAQGAVGPISNRGDNYCRVSRGAIAWPVNLVARVPWQSATFNPSGMFDPLLPTAVGIKVAGLYLVEWGGQAQSVAGGGEHFLLFQNGVRIRNGMTLNTSGFGGQPTSHMNNDVVLCKIGDFFTVSFQTIGTGKQLNNAYLSVGLLVRT